MVEVNFPVIAALVVLVFAVAFFILYKSEKKIVPIDVNGTKVNAEVADNFAKKSVGLMFRDSLGKNDGMLFPFDSEGYYQFWMSNVKFPLDFIWIGKNKTIVDITENARPCTINCTTFTSQKKAQYVLEVNAGFVKEHKIKIGSKVDFSLQ